MWAATKGQAQDAETRDQGRDREKEKDAASGGYEPCSAGGDRYAYGTGANTGPQHHHGQNAFRRLVLSAHGGSRGAGRGAGWSVDNQVFDA
jgi:hypothetical protein